MIRLLPLALAPGLIAYMLGSLLVAWPSGAELFPMIAPESIPGALAVLVTQVWWSGAGLALIGLVVIDSIQTHWRKQ